MNSLDDGNLSLVEILEKNPRKTHTDTFEAVVKIKQNGRLAVAFFCTIYFESVKNYMKSLKCL